MTRKQLVTRTEIAKMAGQDNRHFLDRDARHLKKTAWRHRWIDQIGLSSDWGANRNSNWSQQDHRAGDQRTIPVVADGEPSIVDAHRRVRIS